MRRHLRDGRLAAAQANEAAHAATLLLEGRVGAPVHRARVLGGPGRRGARLVIEGGEGLELRVGEEPELQDIGGKVRVNGTSSELDKGA